MRNGERFLSTVAVTSHSLWQLTGGVSVCAQVGVRDGGVRDGVVHRHMALALDAARVIP